jgi:hypothetical protein
LSNADPGVELKEFTRVAKAEHRIEECFERAKSEAGLGDYQVRNWIAWPHHQTLALLAAWFLTRETRGGKDPDRGVDVAAVETIDRRHDRGIPRRQRSVEDGSPEHTLAGADRAGTVLSPSPP